MACTLLASSGAALADAPGFLEEPFPYIALDRPIRSALADFTRLTGVPAILGDGARGTVTVRDPQGDARAFLDAAAAQNGLIWWRDGGAVRLDPAGAVGSALIALGGAQESDVLARLEELDLLQQRFAIRTTADGAMLRVSGPASYRDAVREVVQSLTPAGGADRPRGAPKVFRGNRSSGG